MQLLEALLPEFGVGRSEGFALEPLMKFAASGFGSAKEDVRAAAVRITTLARAARPLFVHPYCIAGLACLASTSCTWFPRWSRWRE